MSVRLALLALSVLLSAAAARADVFLTGEIRLAPGDQPGSYELGAVLPAGIADAEALDWPANCKQLGFERAPQGNRERISARAVCQGAPARDAFIATRWGLDAARFHSGPDPASPPRTLLPSGDGMRIPFDARVSGDRSLAGLAPAMLGQGILHILFGWDHLAFVLCLCLLARGLLPLLGLVTGFTLGHSLSLGLAFFGWLRVPSPPTEALIALSIVLVAREALLADSAAEHNPANLRAAAVVTLFGLVHGLGFATALGALGIEAGERLAALLLFNVGVELGQIAFVILVAGMLRALSSVRLGGVARRLASCAAGIGGSFWLWQRLVDFS